MKTIFEYATRSWHPIKGCDMSLPCAARCWAKRQVHRLACNPNDKISAFHQGLTHMVPAPLCGMSGDFEGERLLWTGTVKLNEDHFEDPLHWRKPETVAVAYHGDLFLAPADVIDRVFEVMGRCPQHTFLVLTKRSERLRELAPHLQWEPHIWMGVSVENEDYLYRVDDLRRTEAHVKFLSLEPLIGPLRGLNLRGIDWVIVGGESGPAARPMSSQWVRSVRDQCRAAGVPFFFKQAIRGGKKVSMPELDGRVHAEVPIPK